ncbi:hypothetical protein COLO4_20326 [Corchorus olitorius]|uniref:Endonuclease/exonuclease/phosphatase n=1 Tax=Corchorus olitorius TaxID=93759 RepID=A0A1R3J0B5_9ROSI|nr:hypothetical protein COLO4_20326 [Corchorus olitorius]
MVPPLQPSPPPPLPPVATSIIHLLQIHLGISFPSMTINDSTEADITPILIDITKLIVAMVNQIADDGPYISSILRDWLGLTNTDTSNGINIREMLEQPAILSELYSRGMAHRFPPQLALEPTNQDIQFIYPINKVTTLNIDGETRKTYILTTPPIRQVWISEKISIDNSTYQTTHKLQFMSDTTPPRYTSTNHHPTEQLSYNHTSPPLRPIKIIIFNATGAANPEFIYTYAEICFEHNPDFVIVTETRLRGSNSQSMNFTASTSLEPIGYFGGSWFLWNTDHMNFRIIANTQTIMTFKTSFKC